MRLDLRGTFAAFTTAALLAFASPAHAQWKAEGGVLIRGTIVTMDDQGTVTKGSLYVKDGKVVSILPANAPVPAGAIEVDTHGGFIFPGLMNLHNHISYNFEPLYPVPKKYDNRDQWPGAKQYGPLVNNPHALVTKSELYDRETEALKYAEIKALVGGETTVQGAEQDAGISTILVRNVELPNFGQDHIGQSVLPIDQRFVADLPHQVDKIKKLDGFFFHLAEGISDYSRKEYFNPTYNPKKPASPGGNTAGLKNLGLVLPSLIGIHCAALTEADFADWEQTLEAQGAKDAGPKIVWSPLSNMLLYGKTTDILAARKHNATIALGTDWSPSGSKNLLWELKVADQVNEQVFHRALTSRDLVMMVTRNPAKLVHWEDKVGKIAAGMVADLLVVDGDASAADPYKALIAAMEENVQLVLVGGDPLYGDETALKKLKVYNGTPSYEVLPDSPGRTKALDLKRKGVPKGDESLDDVKKALLQALKMDPKELAQILNTANGTGPDAFKSRDTTKKYLVTKLTILKKPVPADLKDPKAPITPDEVAQYLKLRFPTAQPISKLDPIFEQNDKDYFDALQANVFFKDPNPPIDIGKILGYDVTTKGFARKIGTP